MSRHRSRRSEAQWRELVAQYRTCGESTRAFCARHDVGYTSFMAWRKRLDDEAVEHDALPTPTFVELTPPEKFAPCEPRQATRSNTPLKWRLDLALGPVFKLTMWRSP